MIAQAYCAASEDSIQGDYQKADNIKKKMHVNYLNYAVNIQKLIMHLNGTMLGSSGSISGR
jgi:hypothetical protein